MNSKIFNSSQPYLSISYKITLLDNPILALLFEYFPYVCWVYERKCALISFVCLLIFYYYFFLLLSLLFLCFYCWIVLITLDWFPAVCYCACFFPCFCKVITANANEFIQAHHCLITTVYMKSGQLCKEIASFV